MAYNTSITTSGFIPISYTRGYSFVWWDKLVSDVGTGNIKLNFYDGAQALITGISYQMSQAKTSGGWMKNLKILKPYKDLAREGENNVPSGAAYAKVSIVYSGATASTERYVAGVDLMEGYNHVAYSPYNNDSTIVTYNGLLNGALLNSGIMRTDYVHIGDRKWKSEDAAQVPPNNFIYWDDTDAATGTEYTYVIDAYDIIGNKSPLSSQKTIVAGDIYPPAQVTDLMAEGTPESINLTWTSPSDSDYSHVNIYNASGLLANQLIHPEFGIPGAKDSSLIPQLTPSQQYVFWVTTVDKYGNENKTNVPTATGIPTSFEADKLLTLNLDGDKYLKVETAQFKIFSKYNISGLPTCYAKDSADGSITVSGLNTYISGTDFYSWSGNLVVTAGNSEGYGYVYATGQTVSGLSASSNIENFIIDKTAPTTVLAPLDYVFYNAPRYFYNGKNQAKFSAVITDGGAVPSMPKEFSVYITNPSWIQYTLEGTNAAYLELTTEGLNTIYCQARDFAGNTKQDPVSNIVLDSRPPVVKISGIYNWITTSSKTVYFYADDDKRAAYDSGFYRLYYRWAADVAPAGAWSQTAEYVTNPSITLTSIPSSASGVYLEYYATDNAQNQSTIVTEKINVDAVAPVIGANIWQLCKSISGGYQLVWNPYEITDAAPSSGLDKIKLFRSGDNVNFTGIHIMPYSVDQKSYNDTLSSLEYNKYYYWKMKATDFAGNESAYSVVTSGQIGHNIVGIFRNFINNGSFERLDNAVADQPEGWIKYGSPVLITSPRFGEKAASVNFNNYYYIQNFPLINNPATRRWIFSFYAKRTGSAVNAIVNIKCYDANKADIGTLARSYSLTTSYVRCYFTIGNVGDVNFPTGTLSCDIIIKTDNATNAAAIDGIQLERGETSSTTVPTDYVDSYVVSGDILQGQRIIGSQIEADTITTEHLTVGVHAGNMLKNSSFEINQGGGPPIAAWTRLAGATLVTISGGALAYDGDYSINFIGVGTLTYTGGIYIPNRIDRGYCFSAHLKTDTAGTIGLRVNFYDLNKALAGFVDQQFTTTTWARKYISFGYGTANPFPEGTYWMVPLIYNPGSDDKGYVDAVQLEEGVIPSVYNYGGMTSIEGSIIKTGRVQSVDGKTYFDLDGAEIRCMDDATNYSKLTAGKLSFTVSGGTSSYYAHQIQSMSAGVINCGSINSFPHAYASEPQIILMPARMQVYASGYQNKNQYIGFQVENITKTSFKPRAYFYNGAYTVERQTSTEVTDSGATFSTTNTTSYETADAKDESYNGNILSLTINLGARVTETSILGKPTEEWWKRLYNVIRVASGDTWNAATVVATISGYIDIPVGHSPLSQYIYKSTTIPITNAGIYCVKVDYYSNWLSWQGQFYWDQSIGNYSIDYVDYVSDTFSGVEITGTGICHALVIGV